MVTHRSSLSDVVGKKGVLKNFAKFTGKHLCQSLFFNKVAGLKPATLFKKRTWQRCLPVNFAKFLKTHFFIKHLRWPLPNIWNEVESRYFHKKFHRRCVAVSWIYRVRRAKLNVHQTPYEKLMYVNLSRPSPGRREKIKLNFYFHTSLWCLKRFYEGL